MVAQTLGYLFEYKDEYQKNKTDKDEINKTDCIIRVYSFLKKYIQPVDNADSQYYVDEDYSIENQNFKKLLND